MAIVRSCLGMQLPFKVNAHAPSLYLRTASQRRRARAGATGSPQSTQTESRGKHMSENEARAEGRGIESGAEGCSTLAALSGKR